MYGKTEQNREQLLLQPLQTNALKSKTQSTNVRVLGPRKVPQQPQSSSVPLPGSSSKQEKTSPTCSSCVLLGDLQEKDTVTWSWHFSHHCV